MKSLLTVAGASTLGVLALGPWPTYAVDLPVPCAVGSCGAHGPSTWVGSGAATAVQVGSSLTITQSTANTVLNWQSFNIGAGGTVTFKQPNAAAIALNQIFQSDPSRILGALNSNGTVYLINQNGFMFGAGSTVNVGSLLASSLNLTPQALSGILQPVQAGKPALQQATDASGNLLPAGSVTVAAGATMSAPNGEIILAAPQVTNAGTIRADGGQVILAAGDSVFLAGSTDANLRGLLVEVGHGGTVSNAATGVLSSNDGNVSMVGLYVNQLGRVSASTSVRENGSIYLLAQEGGFASATTNGGFSLGASQGGTLELGATSHTDVTLDLNDAAKTVDATPQPHSVVTLTGASVTLASGSEITALSAAVSISAGGAPLAPASSIAPTPGPGRLLIEDGATIDVSGATVELPVSDNVIAVQLRGTELANSPLQRSGPLYGQTVYVDTRISGTLPDGTPWVGSPIANLAGYIAAVPRSVAERNLAGGTISLQSDGAILVAQNATLNLSGGAINYTGGNVNTSKVLGTNGVVYDISQASPNQTYVGVVTSFNASDPKWGTSQTYPTFAPGLQGTYQAGYTQGFDAGALSVVAPAVVLDGSVLGHTVAGPYQTQLPGAVAAGALYRPITQAPRGAELDLGVATPANPSLPNYVAGDVTFVAGDVLGTLTGADGGAFDPLTSPLPASLGTTRLRPELFGPDGIANATIYANGAVTVPAGTAVNLPTGGSLSIRAGSVDIAGAITGTSASVSVSVAPTVAVLPGTPGEALTLEPTAVIAVPGEFVNDLPTATSGAGTNLVATQGGGIALTASGGASVSLESGSLLDVSGGALLGSTGAVSPGHGGSITVAIGQPFGAALLPAEFDSTLKGFAGANGGSLSLTANQICIAAADCRAGDASMLWVAPGLFTDDGFSRVALTSNVGGLTVLPGTTLAPRQLNYLLTGDLSGAATGASLGSIAALGTLPDVGRAPVSVSLTTSVTTGGGSPFTRASFDQAGELTIGHGASIVLDPQGTLTLASNSSIVVDGLLEAPAGAINVSIIPTMPINEFIPEQGIWLLDGARLSAPGVALVTTNSLGQPTGTVLAGGSISVDANRGYLITDSGSSIAAPGTAATIDIASTGPSGAASIAPTVIGSAGGSISLSAAEGFAINGNLAAPGGAAASGGSLNVTLDGNTHGAEPFAGQAVFPLAPRQIVVSDATPVVFGPNTAIPDYLAGIGRLPAALISGGGFASLQLTATDLYDPNGPVSTGIQSVGSIAFAGNTVLQLPGSLRLDASQIVLEGNANVSLGASYVGLGYVDARPGTQDAPTLTPGSGSLTVTANLVDLMGQLGLNGISSTRITSAGDIRGIGVEAIAGTAQPLAGALYAEGSLTLSAAQLYPTTLTSYLIEVEGTGSSVAVLPGSPTAAPLSAGGALTIAADSINQEGVLRAPFGEIALEGNTVSLASGSVTSTSGAGLTVPFGSTQAGVDWVYPLPVGQTQVYTQGGPPAKSVVIQGNQINVAKGATVDLSGGGDLQATEFVPGVGGTIDVLSTAVNPQEFAIVPVSSLAYAPYDPQASAGFIYPTGTTIVIGAGSSVPAGTYAVLPPRYALVPGGYLVQPVAGYTDLTPGTAITAPNGGVIVAGQFGVAGTPYHDARTSGFEILPASGVQTLGTYSITSANQFFADVATTSGTVAPQLPRDAGLLQFVAGSSLTFEGTLSVAPAAGGRGAQVDISATDIEITAANGTASDPAAVALTQTELNALGAQSLLVGGVRSTSAGVVSIDTTASTLTVDSGVSLSGSEIVLAATTSLTVGSGASVVASGANTAAPVGAYDLSGGGAFVRVSTSGLVPVTRSSPDSSAGTLSIAAGAVIGATGSATLEASGTFASGATYQLDGAALAFDASRITLGAPTSGSGTSAGLVINPADLSSLGLSELSLDSHSTIDVVGASTLTVPGAVTLTASGINATTPDAALAVHARSLVLEGTSAPSAGPSASSSGTLSLAADTLELGGGNVRLGGFATVALTGSTEVRASGNGELSADHALDVMTGLLTTSNAVSYTLNAGDTASLLGVSPIAGSVAAAPGSGGSISVNAAGVAIDTVVSLPNGGVLSLTGSGAGPHGGVTFGSHALVDLAGRSVGFDGLTVDGRGGRLQVTAAAGDIVVASGGTIDVSGGGVSGSAGEMLLSAPAGTTGIAGTLQAKSGAQAAGGTLVLTALQLPDLGALNAALNSGGFLATRSFTQTGAGAISVGSGTMIRAGNVAIVNDGGSLTFAGAIDASGSGPGSVLLAATTGLDLEGSIDVHAMNVTSGGTIELDVAGGGITLGTSSAINLGGTGGSLNLRLPRSSLVAADGSVAPQVQLGGAISGGSRLQVEGVATYAPAGGIITADNTVADPSNPWFADASQFAAQAQAIGTSLHAPAALTVSVLPGIEVDSAGDLVLQSAWNLNAWRFNGAPGVLTLRAAGNLDIEASLSDGFADASTFVLPSVPDQSWSYRLVAGATTGSPNPLAVDASGAVPAGGASLVISPGRVDDGPRSPPAPVAIRTGTGTIEIATAGDLDFGNRASVIYTAGAASPAGVPLPLLGNLAYPTGGGDIDIDVGGNILGAATNQLAPAWLWRSGQAPGARSLGSATGWTVNYQWFEENVGALGGGNVHVTAGGDIREFSVALPSIGVQTGGTSAAANSVTVTGGGVLGVESGGAITGGSYYVGKGTGTLSAWAGVGADLSGAAGATGLAPLLEVGDASLTVASRSGITIEDVVNPTLLPQSRLQAPNGAATSVFSTYSASSSVTLVASSGDVVLTNDPSRSNGVTTQITTEAFSSAGSLDALYLYPASLNAVALAGDVDVNGSPIALWPAPRGNLDVLASDSIRFGADQQVFMLDIDPNVFPNAARPATSAGALALLFAAPTAGTAFVPLHSAAADAGGLEDPTPVRVVALNGDISGASFGFLPKATDIVAGGNIDGLYLFSENTGAGDVTLVSAGGNLTYSFPRDSNSGQLIADASRGIVVQGPGALAVTAGGTINLGTSLGVTTVGNLYNPLQAPDGASVTLLAGLTPASADLADFTSTYLAKSSTYDAELLAYVNGLLPQPVAGKADALAAFAQLSATQQFLLLDQIMLAELRLGGEAAAAPGPQHNDYTRSFAALTSLFPGATDTTATGAQSRYDGSISLYFSRVYTLDGGDITLLAPGGSVNVGIATPPVAFGLTKQPSDLGVVAQGPGDVASLSYGDFLVNQSRVFAADGGNILVWSTEGNVDAGRGAKTAISAPAPTIEVTPQGQIVTVFPAALEGSGIQALAVSAGTTPGNVDLFAPHGIVNASDAGIVAGNLTIGATAVLGRDNISVSGVAVGVPVEATGLGASVVGSSSAGSSTSNVAAQTAEGSGGRQAGTALADSAIAWLDVFVTGLGEDNCKPDDLDCLKRQRKQ